MPIFVQILDFHAVRDKIKVVMTHIEGYLLIPHELLHVIGYRLVGKRCNYRWGDNQVRPLDPMTRNERLVGLLCPFVVCTVTWLVLLPLPVLAFFLGGVTWAIIFAVLPAVAFIYAFASIGDLRQAYLLVYKKKPHDKTPLDFLFWPVLKEHTRGLRVSSVVILVCLVVLYISYLLLFR